MIYNSGNFENKSIIEESEPSFVYNELTKDVSSFLIDVRSKPEWNFVGFPYCKNMKNDVIFCEWAFYPLMQKNPYFEDEILSKLNLNNCRNLYFICRSGSRSFNAAFSFQNFINQKQILKNSINCINVKFGFEGDLSEDKRRGISNGWKFSGLPWKQS